MNVEVLEEALEDLVRGYYFYEDQRKDLGRYFIASLFSDIDSLKFHGGVHISLYGYHRMVANRFPFSIYYRVQDGAVFVWRVLDSRRDPRWIRKQLA